MEDRITTDRGRLALAPGDEFVARHIGPSDSEIAHMLGITGHDSLDALVEAAVPDAIFDRDPIDVPEARTEAAVQERLRELADLNQPITSLIGTGYHGTITPPVILRNIMENPAWYTAYTPYQPEISQGRLEALVNFQTMVADLTGCEIANASLLDEGTAAAEAMTMCRRVTKSDSDIFWVDADCHPQTLAVVETRAQPLGIKVMVGSPDSFDDRGFGALIQYPGSSGAVTDPSAVIQRVHDAGGLVAAATDLLALTLLTPPGELGADIVIGSSQRFGVPLGFGGPHAAFLATAEAHKRSMPGRLVGVSVDAAGRPAYRLALQTREQHIRRERATSNICTAQVLLAVMAGMYAVYHGPDGLRAIAQRVHRLTSALAAGLASADVERVNTSAFDTVTVRVPGQANAVLERARDLDLNLRKLDGETLGITFDETSSLQTVATVLSAFGAESDVAALVDDAPSLLPSALERTSDFLTHPVFHRHRSETAMLRYLRKLADRDLALDRTMIPLGSCTMKLNGTTEMIPVTWPEFANIHPFAPAEQAEGYHQLIAELEADLAAITGYDAVSVQPNAGSQGEYAGLLAIRRYHLSRGDEHRAICLIPASAHGTNAASAVMAGMKVVVVGTDDDGSIDLADLSEKIEQHRDELAAIMVTYPSTHGVYETEIGDVCARVHDEGGQVYLDGANLNALVGLARPGRFGSDVSHLNLHKTFCIPHGGGGPGVGPIGVRSHLTPFLPTHPSMARPDSADGPELATISAAPYGSAGILPISWAYLRLMGPAGLRRATEVAVLSANYVARRLQDAFPVLYSGEDGLVAHECILDLRPLEKATGVTNEDVAKRLVDFGFHAPTMSFPVPGTLMVEPTESEDLGELDRFCDAMLAIRAEIDRVGAGEWKSTESPLRHAPHTAADLLADDWDRPYPRSLGAYPDGHTSRDRYFPPVSRIDNAYGDRNLVCSCPPPEAFEDG
jgi:glycine dehydrogenase